MKLNWYLSIILVGILCPNFALSQEIEQNQTSFLKENSSLETTPKADKSFEITDLSNKNPEESNNTVSESTVSNTTDEKPQPKPVETSIPKTTETSTSEETEETTTATTDSCTASPPQVEHPLITPVQVADNETEKPENNAAALSLEKPSEIEEETTQNKEEKEDKILNISQAEIIHYPTLAKADHFYKCGETLLAERFYREVKEPFGSEEELNREILAQAVYEPEYLLPGGAVYWRLYQESLTESEVYKSKRIAPLQLLSQDYPEFIPGHIKYAEILRKDERPEDALKVLENAVSLYPNEAPLVKAKIEADEQAENWLAASLTARQFAVFNQEHFLRDEFKELADKNLDRYQGDLQEQMTWNLVGNAIMSGVGAALMGNVFAPLSTIQTSYLLLQGESAIGESYAEGFKNRLTLIEDPEVTGYINEIGHKLAKVAGRDEFEYEFFVVMDENLNAFALPGGKIFINAGAIAKTSSEAEIAGLLAHELAHSVLSHGFQQMTQGALTSSVVDYIPYIGGIASNLAILSYSRGMEEQADLFGTRLLAATGYAADGLRNLMAVMEDEHQNRPPAWLSTHPDTSDRVKYIETEIVRNNFNRFAYEGVERHQEIRKKVVQLLEEHEAKENGEEIEETPKKDDSELNQETEEN
ncbi:Peptidase M48, Ste24p [Crocosphaera subtropica ATCC 51142]|uniref:Peptidase M48, Ste24p n=1 Tax=Crocosphaera subtropica (strain ATCC 51142 / BH68) TaxID=43989 RepID=B1WUQ4_CROS5|nr:M48 family metallopeptidase [Crocosphaera subtropica]ACB50505.1 Peptidase M48, Ste24p [Crocosphaera subtropica ATCC 51142]